jgi:predicted nucleic acid-binding protein
VPPSETLICDTSFVSHLRRRVRSPKRYEHWDIATVGRVEAASLAISVVTIAETRFGYRLAGWGPSKVESTEQELRRYDPIPVERRYASEWARLRTAARTGGIALSENDLWIAATASVGERVLITCDRDHVRIAPELGVEVLFLAPPV